MVWEILLAVFCAIGLAACIRFAVGRLVYPVQGAIILLPALGDGRLLEQQLKGLTALSGEGKLDIDAIYLADAGLDSDGLAAAEQGETLVYHVDSLGHYSPVEMEVP